MEQSKLFGGDQRLRPSTLIRDCPERGREQEILPGESGGLSSPSPHQNDSTRDDAEAKHEFWSITGDFIHRHHVEPRVKLYMPKEASFPIPLKYIDVTRTTHTSLDVWWEKQIDDYWNVDGERELSDTWTGFTRFTLLNERPPDGYTWSGGDLQENKQPLVQTMYGQTCGSVRLMQRSAKQSKTGSSRNQSSIMPGDCVVFSSLNLTMKNSEDIMKNIRRKFKIPMPAAMPCKTPINSGGETYCGIVNSKTKHAGIVESDESTRIRLKGVPESDEFPPLFVPFNNSCVSL